MDPAVKLAGYRWQLYLVPCAYVNMGSMAHTLDLEGGTDSVRRVRPVRRGRAAGQVQALESRKTFEKAGGEGSHIGAAAEVKALKR